MQGETQRRLRCSKGRETGKKQKTQARRGRRSYHELFNVATQRLEV